jgi:hypothetical protein
MEGHVVGNAEWNMVDRGTNKPHPPFVVIVLKKNVMEDMMIPLCQSNVEPPLPLAKCTQQLHHLEGPLLVMTPGVSMQTKLVVLMGMECSLFSSNVIKRP